MHGRKGAKKAEKRRKMLNIFLIILPVFAVAGIGYLLARFLKLDFSKLSTLSIWLLAPCLTIYTLSIRKFDSAMLAVALASFAVFALLWVISKLGSRFLCLEPKCSLVLVSSTIMMNASYIGLPVCYLAFGNEGLAFAGVFATVNSLIVYTYGVSAISKGKGEARKAEDEASKPKARQNGSGNLAGRVPEFLRIPLFYAAIFAIALSISNIQLPPVLALPIQYVGSLDIFAGLFILGGTLAYAEKKAFDSALLTAISCLKLLVGPALGLGACLVFGVAGIAQKAVILEAGMPVAIYTVILATRYKNESARFAAAVLVSTLLSIITLSVLLLIL